MNVYFILFYIVFSHHCSVKVLKQLLLLDARVRKTRTICNNVFMEYHRTMGEILSMLMQKLQPTEMLAILQECVEQHLWLRY